MSVLPERYSLENVRRILRNPSLVNRELFALALAANRRARAAVRSDPAGIDVMARDWDTLVILDACRYDLFEQSGTDRLQGDLAAVRSAGSDSWEFLQANFAGRELHDTVYVTANPHALRLEEGTFHAVRNVLETGWDETLETVPPDAMATAAIEAHEAYPNKRLVVHFMQPHFPFIGPTGTAIEAQGLNRELEEETLNPWYGILSGDVDRGTVLRAYRENLELALPHVESILEAVPGQTVVTADHGNLVGERGRPIPVRLYGHPRGLPRSELVTVPWLEIANPPRREITAETPEERTEADDETVEDRLRALGYT